MNQHNRKDPRAKVVSMTVRYRSATLNEFIEHHSYDVSRGGVFIKTPSPFPPGTLLKFEVKIADDQRVMQGVGRVVWKRDNPGGKDEPTGMGIKFIKLDDASRAVIERLVASRGDDTVSAYDRSPESRPADMFPTAGEFGSEDPTVIRPRDEVLAGVPKGDSGAGPSMPVPSGPALSVGAASSPLLSDPPLSMPDSRVASSKSPQSSTQAAPAVARSSRPTSRSIPRNPVTSEPPKDATSRGVLWVTLVAIAVGGGLAYLNWARGEAPPPTGPAPALPAAPAAIEPSVEPEKALEDQPLAEPEELKAKELDPSPAADPPSPEPGVEVPPAEEPAPAAVIPPAPPPPVKRQAKPKVQPKAPADDATKRDAPALVPEAGEAKPETAPSAPASAATPEAPAAAAEDEFQ